MEFITNVLQKSSFKYSDDIYASKLYSGIRESITFDNLLQSFLNHSTLISQDDNIAPDYLNGCDGDDSPLSVFIYELIKPENIDNFKVMLDGIKTNDDYIKYQWIIDDLNMLLFTNPKKYNDNIVAFIKHDIIGRKFNFFSAIWVNSCYYDCNDIDINEVDEMYLSYLELYKSLYQTNPSSRHNSPTQTIINAKTGKKTERVLYYEPFNWKQYLAEVKKELTWRKLFELKKTLIYINSQN